MRRTEVVAFVCALAGCGSGCDGERSQKSTARPPDVLVRESQAGGSTARPGEAEGGVALPVTSGLLDAPPGTLDGRFTGLDAAEKRDPAGRGDIAMFGDSHTAGDSMTSRLRQTWQHQIGDAGRGLVAAGKAPTRHYYQRDVRYGISGEWMAAGGGKHGDSEPRGIAGLRVFGKQ